MLFWHPIYESGSLLKILPVQKAMHCRKKGAKLSHFAKEMANYEVQRTETIIAHRKYFGGVTAEWKPICWSKNSSESQKFTNNISLKEGYVTDIHILCNMFG